MARPKKDLDKKPSRELLLEAATELIRTNGYTSTTVDELCEKAGVSKGTFFHNFTSKEDLGVAAAHRWSEITSEFFRSAPYHLKRNFKRGFARIYLSRRNDGTRSLFNSPGN